MDPPRLYCGDKAPLPPGYGGYDTRFNCLRKGVGIGLYRIRNGNGPPLTVNNNALSFWRRVPWWVWAVLLLLLVILLVLLVR
jgi:hypothetical protein